MDDLIARHRAEACVGCGRCTYACVAAQRGVSFSPRRLVEDAMEGRPVTGGLWTCTACGSCSQVCNAGVDLPQLVRELRSRAGRARLPVMAHHGVLNRTARLSASPGLEPRTDGWTAPDLDIDPRSDVLLFVGCTPYFDVALRYIRDDLLEIPRSAVRLLNAMGVRPRVLRSERCCGHDAYWAGDDALFRRLAKANLEAVRDAGIKEIVTFCPECASTWRDLYPAQFGRTGLKVTTLVEKMAEGLTSGRLRLRDGSGVATYQDPCRLSKGAGIVEQPRTVLRLTGEVAEMPRSGAMSACCGTAGWAECDHTAKKVQMERLREAAGTAADSLVTSCPKCLIHLSCADRHHGGELPRRLRIEDLHVRAARHLEP
ncbi:MAG: (Fe-S)-binding protein [Methanomassiliicoccus sp.]|nr:(Fe-S)-binding protein [Methanomassiliicoccus sp.]